MPRHKKDHDEIKDLLNINLEKLNELDILEDDEKHEEEIESKKPSLPPAEIEKKNSKIQKLNPKSLLNQKKVRDIEEKFKSENEVKPKGSALKDEIKQVSFSDRSDEYLDNTRLSYDQAVKQTEQLFTKLIKGNSYSNQAIRKLIKTFIKVLMEDQSILVNFSSLDQNPDDYLYHHALNTCLLSINIATILGYSKHQIIEVGSAGLLADLGMMLTPDNIRKKTGKLNNDDRFEISKHPIVGVYFIEKIMGIPDRISYVSYQHHERLNGNGYPRKRDARIIHDYSKIIAIADVYEAMTSSRPYRDAIHPFDAILELTKMAKMGELDMNIIRAILPVTSVYPVGCLVKISNNCVAKVVKSNGGSALTQPLVTVVADEDGIILPRADMYQIDLLKQKDDFDIINTINFRDLRDLNSTAGF